MSVQFGRWHFDRRPLAPDCLEEVHKTLAEYGPDGGHSHFGDGLSIIYRAFHTTRESRRETQPHVTASGAVIAWDGRLDNRAEFIGLMKEELSIDSADVSIVAAAYERWGTGCLAAMAGDWALSISNPRERTLILAKDPIGTRQLYYSFDHEHVAWSTILEPLVLFAGKRLALNEEYIAGWLSYFPAAHLTPYIGIHSVPPSAFVRFEIGKHAVTKYWDFDPAKRIRYRTDAEYEEHFRALFAQSVRRRLRSDSPVLAELSGGMDSSSIVCMADRIMGSGASGTSRLDTISYYNDSEPNWDERPYFTKVEEKRGRTGCHIDVSSQQSFELDFGRFASTPAAGHRHAMVTDRVTECMTSQGNRVLLSGIGGDEVTGGVPTPIPELADLLANARFRALAHGLKIWALNKRKPWIHLLSETVREFLPSAIVGIVKHRRPEPWLHPNFVKRYGAALSGYESRLSLFGPPPSFQDNLSTLNVLRRHLACSTLSSSPLCETRYPYLDRSLLEFMYAIPREQILRPGQRRSLMRRALLGIVPGEILNRKRKAYVVRAPIAAISAEWASLAEITQHMISDSLGIVDSRGISEALQNARHGRETPIVPLMRALGIEIWLRNASHWNVLKEPPVDHDASAPASIRSRVFG